MKELIQTEKDYVYDLEHIVKGYLKEFARAGKKIPAYLYQNKIVLVFLWGVEGDLPAVREGRGKLAKMLQFRLKIRCSECHWEVCRFKECQAGVAFCLGRGKGRGATFSRRVV